MKHIQCLNLTLKLLLLELFLTSHDFMTLSKLSGVIRRRVFISLSVSHCLFIEKAKIIFAEFSEHCHAMSFRPNTKSYSELVSTVQELIFSLGFVNLRKCLKVLVDIAHKNGNKR